jgi:hypothetical protein
MRCLPFAALLVLTATLSKADESTLLSRVAEEADVLEQNLPKAITRETLEQRALLPPSRFRPRAGAAALEVPTPRLLVREVVSEYTVAPLHESNSQSLVEYRQVFTVDGKAVQSEEKARHALSLGMKSLDDRLRKRMLEDFAKHGLVDVATDYGLILLEFTRKGQAELEIRRLGEDRVGSETAIVFSWRQKSPERGELEFNGRRADRHPLEGRLWVRATDGVPLRVHVWAEHLQADHKLRDEAAVDYTLNSRGFLTPASVLHQHLVDGQLMTENHYTYEPFKVFSADAEIKFTEVGDPPK